MQSELLKTQNFAIEGMMCQACAGHVTRALLGLGGVQSAQVSLTEHQAVVTYDPAQVQAAQLVEAVAEEGYEASPRG